MCQDDARFEAVALADDQDARRMQGRRRQAERLMALAALLPDGDRLLLKQVFELGLRPADIAKAAKCDRQSIYRRLHRLIRRLRQPLFLFVAAAYDTFDPDARRVARAIVLHGLPQRQAAACTGLTVHQVRQQLERLRTLARREAMVSFKRQ